VLGSYFFPYFYCTLCLKKNVQCAYTKTEACKLYSGVFWIFLPNVIKIDPYNFELYRFKVGAFFQDTVSATGSDVITNTVIIQIRGKNLFVLVICLLKATWLNMTSFPGLWYTITLTVPRYPLTITCICVRMYRRKFIHRYHSKF